MDWDLYRRVMDDIGRLGGWYVGLNRFGESLLYPRFVDAVRYAKQQGILRVAVVTNGTLLDEEKAEQILDSGLDQLLISLDSLDREAYEAARKGANLDRVVANVDRFLELRRRRGNGKPEEVIINSVLIDQSVDQVRALFEKYQHQVTRISLKPCARYGKGQELAVPGVSRRRWRTCTQPWERLNIFWDGDATVCCGDVEGDLVVGNVKHASLEQLWLHTERAREIRRLHHLQQFDALPVCQQCDATNADFFEESVQRLRQLHAKLGLGHRVVGMHDTTPVVARPGDTAETRRRLSDVGISREDLEP
jgi:hypothetical protein